MALMQKSFPMQISAVDTILDLNGPSWCYRQYWYYGVPTFSYTQVNVSFLVSLVVKRIMEKLAGVGQLFKHAFYT